MSTHTDIPGYLKGSWVIDPASSVVSFQARLLGVFTSRGTFDDFQGTIVTGESPLDSSVSAIIKTASVNTRNRRRDRDLHKGDFLDVGRHPTITFTSTGVRAAGDHFLVEGDLTIRGTTKPVTLELTSNGFGADGQPLARFTAATEIRCSEFGVTRGMAALAISDEVKVTLEIQARK